MSKDRILLLVDLSYQIYRAAAAHPMLTSRRIFTGGLYGFFTSIAKMIRDTKATEVVFCQDVKPYKRSETYPRYKQLRKKDADEELLMMFNQSMKLVVEAIHATGLPLWGVPGFEFDDLVAHAAIRYRHRYDTIWGGTNDSDVYQLFWCHNFKVYRKSLADVMDAKTFARDFRMTPEQYVLWLALQGTHNDIEGIAQVGPKTATTIVTSPAVLRKYRETHGELIARNESLIRLPHPALPVSTPLPRAERYRPRELYRTLTVYDIDVTASIERAFQQVGGK